MLSFYVKVLLVATKSPWFKRNIQIRNETGVYPVSLYQKKILKRCLKHSETVSDKKIAKLAVQRLK